jgi:hypothetical protein
MVGGAAGTEKARELASVIHVEESVVETSAQKA